MPGGVSVAGAVEVSVERQRRLDNCLVPLPALFDADQFLEALVRAQNMAAGGNLKYAIVRHLAYAVLPTRPEPYLLVTIEWEA
jgi:hypothetical protein